ncbi:histidine kinase [Halorubellus sp. JP-L1]|uniref:sensor domain-containing protein n=1 Tax=Halorubellus sp. JP-L1 TaxID=2715753 RepID=UPI00140A7FC6|nr:sensor domain-containing protein [Halorubellus sp. JP-L1]NHN41491.1 histidine kinase [Halorubellus sp. JP-L1]
MVAMASARVREYAGAFLAVPVRQQTYLNLLYLSLSLPLGFAYLLFVALGVGLGVGLAVVLVGVPLLLGVLVVALGLGSLERALAAFLLDLDVEARAFDADASITERAVALATDVGTWKTVVYLPTKFALGLATLVVGTGVIATGVSMLLVPLYYHEPGLYVGVVSDRPVELHPTLYVAWDTLLVGFEAVWTLGAWRVSTLAEAVVVAALGALLLLAGLHITNALARVSKWYTAFMLADAYDVLGVGR